MGTLQGMISLGIILLVLGALGAIVASLIHNGIAVRVGLGVAALGAVLILLGYLLPALTPVGDHGGITSSPTISI